MPATITESLTAVDDANCYTEAHLYSDGRIQLHVETDAPEPVEPIYTIEQARKLHETLGHLLYLANQEA